MPEARRVSFSRQLPLPGIKAIVSAGDLWQSRPSKQFDLAPLLTIPLLTTRKMPEVYIRRFISFRWKSEKDPALAPLGDIPLDRKDRDIPGQFFNGINWIVAGCRIPA